MNRKTKSLPLFLQCCGRGSRLYPGKKEFIVLDFGENHNEHGMWEESRTWKLKTPKKKKKQAAPVKTCPDCEAMIHASIMKCKYCGHIWEKEAEEQTEGKMVEVKPHTPEYLVGRKISELDLDELIKLQEAKKYKASFIWRVVRNRGKEYIVKYAEIKGYSKGWINHQIKEMSNSSFKDYILR